MRLFSLVLLLLSASALINPRNGLIHFFLWLPKLLAVALSPVLALASGLMALLGRREEDRLVVGLGLMGTAVALQQFIAVTEPHDAAMDHAFGPGWEQRIPVILRARMSRRRWQPLVFGERPGILQRDIIYGINPDARVPLYADILRPPRDVSPTGLAMIYVHGGAWKYGRRNIGKFPYFRQLAAQGHLIMDIDYTLNPHTSLPGMVMDVKRAILWLKEHADYYQVNPERIVLTGQSAGGHLSLLAAYTPNFTGFQPPEISGDTSVRGVISYYGPPDMATLHEDIEASFALLFSEWMNRGVNRVLARVGEETLALGIAGLVGGPLTDMPEMYQLISPISYVDAACPPTMLLHGVHDLLVNRQAVENLRHALLVESVPVVYLPLAGCDHSFESILPRVSPAAQTAVYYMERFLALLV
jgi:acetyl esterase/lipase